MHPALTQQIQSANVSQLRGTGRSRTQAASRGVNDHRVLRWLTLTPRRTTD